MKGRIVFLCPGLTEPGGTARRSRLIAEGLTERGWEIKVIARAGILDRVRIERAPGLTIVELPGFGKQRLGGAVFYLLALPLAIFWGVRARAFLALQLLSTSTVAAICSLLLRKPFVAMASTSGELSEAKYIAASRTAGIRRRLLARARALVAQTDEVAVQLESLADSRSIHVLPNPVRLPAALPPRVEEPAVLYSGRLSVEKDLDGLLTAWTAVLTSHPRAQLTMLGAGGDFRSVEDQLRKRVSETPELRSSVSMPGWADDVPAYLAINSVFVLPTLEEGMSNALLEACAWGLLPVVSDIPPSIATVGPEHRFHFPAGDTEQMTIALVAALDAVKSEEGAKIRNQVLTRVRSEFAAEAIIARLERLIVEDRPRN